MRELSRAEPRAVKSAFRALELLELMARERRQLGFAEFERLLKYPKASLHSMLRTMALRGWITLDAESRKYSLGLRVREVASAYDSMFPLDAVALPYMKQVRDRTTETVQLAVLDGGDALYIGKVDGEHSLRLDSTVGQRLTPHATGVGKVLLSQLSPNEISQWLRGRKLERFTPTTIVEAKKLLVELGRIRKRGYAIDREERTRGAVCVAIPIRNSAGECVAAMSVSAPAVRFGTKQQQLACAHLKTAAAGIASAIGARQFPVGVHR